MIRNIIIFIGLLWSLAVCAQVARRPYLNPQEFKLPFRILNEPIETNPLYTCHDITPIALPTNPAVPGIKFSEKCMKFIDRFGAYGPYGFEVSEYILSQPDSSSRFLNKDIPGMVSDPGTCPKWKSFDNNQKIQFWVWVMASIAHTESSCDPNSVNRGRVPDPSDRPRGLFQLNTLKSKRSWRGPNCGFSSKVADVLNPKNNIRCAMDIMDELLKGSEGEYKSNGKIYPTNSYWQKLRKKDPAGGTIAKLIKTYPLCD